MTEELQPYDNLYSAREDRILWGAEPGRLIKKIKDYLPSGAILDIGCGDGKNSLFLEKEGFTVTGYDCSIPALQGLKNRFENDGQPIRGTYQLRNIENNIPKGQYDALISYGIFHCLNPQSRISTHLNIQALVKTGGYIFFTCLTDVLPLPARHGTSHIYLAGVKEVKLLLEGWNILHTERGEIVEEHLPVIGEHSHSAIWIIAQKGD